jgi:hypothetical protein
LVTTAVKSTVPGASRSVFTQSVRNAAKEGAKVGAVSGGAYSAGDELTQDDSTIGSALVEGAKGAAIGAAAGGALGTAVPYATKLLSPAEKAARRAESVNESLRRVATSRKGFLDRDRDATARALRELDLDGVETNADLIARADEKIKNISENLDAVLETNPTKRNLKQLEYSTSVDGKTVRTNYVEQAIDQLEKEYIKTNNVAGVAQVQSLRNKANIEGLTIKEVNDLAKLHGKDLSGFSPLTNELSSGLAKQAAENTRKGLKDTARSNFGDKVYKEADRAISDISRIKKLAEDRATKVEKFKSTQVSPSLISRASGLMEQAINIATLGTSRSLVSAALKGASKAETKLNALDLEARLAKDLRLIQEASEKGASDDLIIAKLQQFIRNNGEKPVLLLEAPKPKPLFATAKGKISPIAQEAADIAAVETGKAKVPKTGPYYRQKVREIEDRLEQYLTPEEMRVIQMGPKPPPKSTGLPTADDVPPNVYSSAVSKLDKYLTPEEMEIIDWGPKPKKKLFTGPTIEF